jgi:hypothetical protein
MLTIDSKLTLDSFLAYKSQAESQNNNRFFQIKNHLFVLRVLILFRSRRVRLDVLNVLASSDRSLKNFS